MFLPSATAANMEEIWRFVVAFWAEVPKHPILGTERRER
jgi:hypothetical protein